MWNVKKFGQHRSCLSGIPVGRMLAVEDKIKWRKRLQKASQGISRS